jgi:hypothetical protein
MGQPVLHHSFNNSDRATLEGYVEDGMSRWMPPAERQENFLANCLARASAVASAI